MIVDTKGDAVKMLINKEVNWLIHCANCENKMGAGIAKQIKKQIPQAFEADYKHCTYEYGHHGKRCKFGDISKILGTISVGKIDDNHGVINLYGQEKINRTKRMVNYEALAKGFEIIVKGANRHPGHKFAIPKFLGCGLGGGSWEIVLSMIRHYFFNLSNIFYIVKVHEESLRELEKQKP